MRAIEELDHYDLLELPRGADGPQIEKAYRTLRATYAPDSLAIYSILDASDAKFIRNRIEQAYRVLSDEEKRHHYDVFLVQGLPPGPDNELEPAAEELEVAEAGSPQPASGTAAPENEEAQASLEPLEPLTDSDAAYNGAKLRRARLRRGLEIDQLASITKISPNYLRCIEEERYDELPAAVYVRGFVAAASRALGLDADEVVNRYIARLEAARSEPRRSRFLGRT